MIVIRTAEEMARALASPPPADLACVLQEHVARLADCPGYTLADLALFVIVEPGDLLTEIVAACPLGLLKVGDGEAEFTLPAELGRIHAGWIELTFILSDDGFGLVLFVSKAAGTNSVLLTACESALRDMERHSSS